MTVLQCVGRHDHIRTLDAGTLRGSDLHVHDVILFRQQFCQSVLHALIASAIQVPVDRNQIELAAAAQETRRDQMGTIVLSAAMFAAHRPLIIDIPFPLPSGQHALSSLAEGRVRICIHTGGPSEDIPFHPSHLRPVTGSW